VSTNRKAILIIVVGLAVVFLVVLMLGGESAGRFGPVGW
jgi:hypothetical protein